MSTSNKKPNRKELRSFALIMAGGLIGLFGLFFPWMGDKPIRLTEWPWIVGVIFIGFGTTAPGLLKPIYGAWMKIGLVLGAINSRIILGVVYFLIFLPVSFFFKIIGKDPMHRKFDRKISTYRVESKQPKTSNLEKPF